MLAEEYKLVDISLIICSPGWTNPGWPGQVSRATEYNINCVNFTQQRFGLTNHGLSAQLVPPQRKQKALTLAASITDNTQIDLV